MMLRDVLLGWGTFPIFGQATFAPPSNLENMNVEHKKFHFLKIGPFLILQPGIFWKCHFWAFSQYWIFQSKLEDRQVTPRWKAYVMQRNNLTCLIQTCLGSHKRFNGHITYPSIGKFRHKCAISRPLFTPLNSHMGRCERLILPSFCRP